MQQKSLYTYTYSKIWSYHTQKFCLFTPFPFPSPPPKKNTILLPWQEDSKWRGFKIPCPTNIKKPRPRYVLFIPFIYIYIHRYYVYMCVSNPNKYTKQQNQQKILITKSFAQINQYLFILYYSVLYCFIVVLSSTHLILHHTKYLQYPHSEYRLL